MKTGVSRVLRAVRIDTATAALVIFGIGTAVVSRFGRRYRGMAEQMKQAAEERGRLLDAERLARLESDEARRHAQARKAELERVTVSRAALIRGFSHDVKNPLGAAAGDLQMLGKEFLGPLNDQQKESVDRASRSVGAAVRLIEDLLDLASVHTIEIERRRFDLNAAVDEISRASLAQAEMKRLTLSLEADDPFMAIESDATRVRQILANLVSNAVKYTERGGITLRVEAHEHDGRTWAVVNVADTGPGIPEDEHPMLFDEFQRLGTARRTTGAGIGLAISQRIAEALGGHITVQSTPGQGSVFSLWLPVERDASSRPIAIGA